MYINGQCKNVEIFLTVTQCYRKQRSRDHPTWRLWCPFCLEVCLWSQLTVVSWGISKRFLWHYIKSSICIICSISIKVESFNWYIKTNLITIIVPPFSVIFFSERNIYDLFSVLYNCILLRTSCQLKVFR